LSHSARNASFGIAIHAGIKITIHAGGVMLLIAANVTNSSLVITATDMDVSIAWIYVHVPVVTFMYVPTALTNAIVHVSFVVMLFVLIMPTTVKNAQTCSVSTARIGIPCVITNPYFQIMMIANSL